MATKTATKPKLAAAKSKAKSAYTKGTAALGEITTFTKGNVDAAVESGKILGAGLKTLGEGYVSEGRSAVAAFNSDIKELTGVRSPVEFFKLQSKIVGRNLGTAIDFHSKNAEAMVQLAKDSATPITKRVGIAIEAVRKPA